MKTKFLIILALTIMLSNAYSQKIGDLFDKKSETKITWLGIDYSHVQLIGDFAQFGDAGDSSSEKIKDDYFPAWNEFVYKEAAKYNVKKMLKISRVKINLDMINKLNRQTDADKLEATESIEFTDELIKSFVDSYEVKDIEGLGVLFITEFMNKNKQQAVYHYIVINNSTKEILLSERITGKCGGFGLKNYWARSFYNSFIYIEKNNKKYYKKYVTE